MKKILFIIVLVVATGMASSASALTVLPAKMEIVGDPGTTVQNKIELFNEQGEEKTFYLSFENFEPSGDSGIPHFIGANDGLATWLKAQNKVVLQSGERIEVPFSIDIPENTDPGGYFAAVFFGTQEPGVMGSGQVTVGAKVGVLILLRVSGEIEEGGGLLEFTTKEKQKFFTSLPVSFSYRINNTGGDRIVPKGEIKIKNTLRFNSATLLANKNNGSILPSSTRKFETVWGQTTEPENDLKLKETTTGFVGNVKEWFTGFFKKAGEQWSEFHFGWYTAEVNVVWGTTNQTGNASYGFWVIPWQLLLVVLVILLIIFYLGKRIVQKYNRFIIAKAQATQYTAHTPQNFEGTQNKQQNE